MFGFNFDMGLRRAVPRHILPFIIVLLTGTLCGAQSLPAGFVDELVVGGFQQPTGICHLPDGRIIVLEEFTAAVHVVADGQKAVAGIVPNVRTLNAEGVLGVAADPQWPVRPFLYILYTSDLGTVAVSRFECTGDLNNGTSLNLVLGARHEVINDIPDFNSGHNGGSLRFGPDGMLYVSLGEDEFICIAQDPSILGGCILRLDVSTLPTTAGGPPPKSQLIPPGNPLSGPDDNARLVWCMGLRNPFRFHIDPVEGDLFICDVGSDLYEEINISSVGGENFGWPWYEGPQALVGCGGSAPTLTPPVDYLDRSTIQLPVAAHISLSFYRNPQSGTWAFGPAYEGHYFYVDFYSGNVRRLAWDGSQWATPAPVAGQPDPQNWATGFPYITDGSVGPDGGIYYIRQVPTELRVIRPDPNAQILSVVSGNNQVGNANQPLAQPFTVQLTNPSGTPIPGAPVTFSEGSGIGTFGPQPVMTDANGMASTSYQLGILPPTISASAPGSSTVSLQITWRGLLANAGVGGLPYVTLWFSHSQTLSPFSLAVEPPTVPTAIPTIAGDVWTTILNPGPLLLVADGLGLVGPASPAYLTGAVAPTWQYTLWNPPASLSGVTLVCQAYAIDTTLPFPLNFVVTNAPHLTFP